MKKLTEMVEHNSPEDSRRSVRVLSIKQPWASLIAAGIKDVENRTWRTNYRGRLYIHASRAIDREGMAEFGHLMDDYPRQAIIGSVELLDCVEHSTSAWAMSDCWNWQLAESEWLPEPLEVGGRLGLWSLEAPRLATPAPRSGRPTQTRP